MSNFLITGGAGFVGSNLANRLAEDSDNNVVVVDNLLTGEKENIAQKANINFFKIDVNNKESLKKIFNDHRFDYVYHYAAVVGVQRTLENPISVLEDIEGIKNVLHFSKESNVKRVFYSSSSEVYGEPVEMPQHEDTTPLNARLPYAIVKNVGESYFRSYQEEYGLPYTIFRFFNTFGPGQSTDFVMSKFIAAANKNQDITVYGDGSQSRTFCYIDDNIEATTNALNDESAINQEFNIGDDREITVLDLAKTIIRITGSDSKIIHLPALERGDMTRRQPDITKMKKLLKRELTTLDEGIKKLIDHQAKYRR